MKIAFDHQIFTIQPYGGISRYCARLAQFLAESNETVRIFAPFHINNYLPDLQNEIVHSIKLDKYPLKSARLFLALNHYIGNMQINSWKPDIVHETYFSSMPLINRKIPTVITVYDMIQELFSSMYPIKDKTTQQKRNALKHADHIISISHSTKKDLIRLFDIPEQKITVVHLGFENINISNNLPQNPESGITKPFLLFVGARGGYKNFSGLLKAVSSSIKLKGDFNIIAFGGGSLTLQEKKMITELGFDQNQVQQIGGTDEKLGILYRQASAFVYPTLYEGFGLPPLEAMAQNCPVVSSNTSSMPEVIGNAAEFFDPKYDEGLMSSIENVVYSEERKLQLKELGRERLNYFSWEKCASETLDVYKTLL